MPISSTLVERIASGSNEASAIERFARLFEQAPTFLALLHGPEHRYELANASYLALIGHRAVLGRTVAEALPEAAEQGYLALLDQVYRTGTSYSARGSRFAFRATPDSPLTECFVDFAYHAIRAPDGTVTGILVQGVDVTERALTERALRLDRARLDYATRLSGIGFWYCDLPFDTLEWDARVKAHFFFPPDARITIDDFYARIHVDDRDATRRAIEASILDRTPYDVVYRTVEPDSGEVNWIRALGGTDYATDGTPLRFDGVTVDVSAQKRDQQRLARLNQQLRDQDRRKDAFIATLSHELRNPLAPLRAAARVIAAADVTPEQLRRAQAIVERQVGHMAMLLDDLLDIARITLGKLQLRKQMLPLNDIVDAAVEAVRPALDRKAQSLTLSMPPERVLLDVDPLRVVQILSNLMTNASKYSDPGRSIALRCALDPEALAISVKDEGIGIPPQAIDTIFEMFSQIDGNEGRGDGGLGIGLALVKGLTALHGGTVSVRSDGIGHGSEFVVRLPRTAESRIDGPDATTPDAAAPARRRVLIADDNGDAADSLAMFLELAGHEVRIANGGEAAQVIARSFRPDVAVLDIGMPDVSGYEVARSLRRESGGRAIALIAVTGWGQENDRRRALEAGFDHHLIKPVDPDRLAQLLAN